MNHDKTTANFYFRALAESNEKLGWEAIPDCPMETFAQIMRRRQSEHPEAATYTVENRGRVFSEKAWHSNKLANVRPTEWIPEYAWLMAIAYVDGTFELDVRAIWARAYAFNRPDWTPEQVGKLLDEFERVGLLQRTTDKEGVVWGFWTGSDKFLPPPSHRDRYKVGKRSLFGDIKDDSSSTPDDIQPASSTPQENCPLGVGVGLGFGKGKDKTKDLDSGASKESENGQPEQVKNVSEANLSPKSVEAKAEPKPDEFSTRLAYSAACFKAGVLPKPRSPRSKEILSKDEYYDQHPEKLAAQMLRDFGVVPDGNGGWKPQEKKP